MAKRKFDERLNRLNQQLDRAASLFESAYSKVRRNWTLMEKYRKASERLVKAVRRRESELDDMASLAKRLPDEVASFRSGN